jgi:hypothetical protein
MRQSAFPKKGIERPRVRMSDALRQAGMDETTVAEGYVGVVKKLGGKNDKGDTVEKLFVDVLKECARHLDQPRPASVTAATAPSDGRVTINLIHNVARPPRESLQSGEIASAAEGAVECAAE